MKNERRLQQQINNLQEKWDLLSEKLFCLEKAKILSNYPEEEFRLEKKVSELNRKRQRIEQQLRDLEAQLVSGNRSGVDGFFVQNSTKGLNNQNFLSQMCGINNCEPSKCDAKNIFKNLLLIFSICMLMVASFILIAQSWKNLKSELIPYKIWGDSRLLEDHKFTGASESSNVVKNRMEDEQAIKYKKLILRRASNFTGAKKNQLLHGRVIRQDHP